MKGKALRKHSLHEKTAASVLLKPFIKLENVLTWKKHGKWYISRLLISTFPLAGWKRDTLYGYEGEDCTGRLPCSQTASCGRGKTRTKDTRTPPQGQVSKARSG